MATRIFNHSLQGDAMRPLLSAMLALVLAAPVARSQSVCLPNDATGQKLLSYMRRYVVQPTGGNETVRVALGLSLITDSTTVTLVTLEQVCKKARDAYIANLPGGTPAVAPGGRVYVVSIGTTYAVLDPVYRASAISSVTIQIFDSRYRLMKFFG